MAVLNNIINVQAPNKPLNSISSITTLASTAFGQLVVCTGGSAYTVTLPSVTNNAGKYIEFSFITTSNAIVTLSPASGTIDGQVTIKYGSNEGCTIYCDGTNWITINKKLMPVYFSATANATQPINNNTLTAVTNNGTVSFDIGSFFNSGTGVYTPLYPGKYITGARAAFASGTWTAVGEIFIYVGAGQVSANFHNPLTAAATTDSFSITAIVPLNGSTDTISYRVLQQTGGALNIQNSATLCNFWAYRIDNI